MKAVPLVRRRIVISVDAFADVSIWRVSYPVIPSRHPFKYRLAYVVAGECVLRYDNERGHGDHRHIGGSRVSYTFTTPKQLILDFQSDIARWNHENGRS